MSSVYKSGGIPSVLARNSSWIDCSDIEGCRRYCDSDAWAEIGRRCAGIPVEDVHFIDSGDYHYLSLLWLLKIDKPFVLIVFDHHTDAQAPAFEGLISCGGWVEEAVEKNPRLEHAYIIGCRRDHGGDAPVTNPKITLLDHLTEITSLPDLPVYLSIDKDVLAGLPSDWDNGDMPLEELLDGVASLRDRLLAVDICGECTREGIKLHERVNELITNTLNYDFHKRENPDPARTDAG